LTQEIIFLPRELRALVLEDTVPVLSAMRVPKNLLSETTLGNGVIRHAVRRFTDALATRGAVQDALARLLVKALIFVMSVM